MARGRQKSTEVPEEVVAVQNEQVKDAEDTSFGELVDIEVTDEDIAAAEVEAETEEVADEVAEETGIAEDEESEVVPDTEDYGDEEEDIAEVAKIPDGHIGFVYVGFKTDDRPASAVSVIVPADGSDASGFIDTGHDFTLRLNVPAHGTEHQVEWLEGHPVYDIKRT